ncbi:spermidine synthase [candidate division KSB3 bacterium]|uniref:Polyamine aminopropyltransferase n=1 Tax=candidate division KSB3 bacterium TaxID=2044937 RepID=A0A2G6KAL2_9BACT|nr:MAG: spermidine synthase [candidate division KSB3 bacterium]
MTDSQRHTSPSSAARLILLCSVCVVAACGLVYELVAGAVSSYILGDAVTQFSLVIGVFLCAMGIGSYTAKFIQKRLLEIFIELEIWIGLIGGCSSMLMFAISAFADGLFPVFFYTLCATLGLGIGIEIPLIIRLLQQYAGEMSDALSHVLALDYIGSLAGSLLFPFVALPYLGLSRASVVFGIMNLGVAAVGIGLLGKSRRRPIIARLALATVILLVTFFFSTRLVGFLEDLLYQDSIIYTETTPYQRIVLTRWRDDIRLYLNGHIQFSSIDEVRYHESLVIPAMEAAAPARDVLILGGGDGMAAREVLKYPSVEHITVVDIDPAITQLGQYRAELVALNANALNSSKVTILNIDGMRFLEEYQEFFDVILIDLPDPNTETLSKLYSVSFYTLCARRLRPNGVFVTQATSPFFAREAYWCIVNTIAATSEEENPTTSVFPIPYHVNVPSFGEWGFVMAGKRRIAHNKLAVSVNTRFLTFEKLHAMFAFGSDIVLSPEAVGVNRLEHPILYTYYIEGWNRFNE